MFSNTRKVKWWKIENHMKLATIIPLLSLDYTEESSEEGSITLNHGWLPFERDSVFNESIKNFNIGDSEGRYLPVFAKIDIVRVREDWIKQVPEEMAIGQYLLPVLFVECNSAINAIVSAPLNCFSKIRTRIMKIYGSENLWGTVSLNAYSLGTSFFYWLMNKKGTEMQLNNEKFILKDVVGFRSATERQKHKYKGSGQGIDKEVPVQAMVCLNTGFSGLDLILKNKECNIIFSLADNWEIKVEFTKCNKIINSQFQSFDDCELLLKIFIQIIPGMVILFKADTLWPQKEAHFRQTVGLRAIKEIMEENGISLLDIERSS